MVCWLSTNQMQRRNVQGQIKLMMMMVRTIMMMLMMVSVWNWWFCLEVNGSIVTFVSDGSTRCLFVFQHCACARVLLFFLRILLCACLCLVLIYCPAHIYPGWLGLQPRCFPTQTHWSTHAVFCLDGKQIYSCVRKQMKPVSEKLQHRSRTRDESTPAAEGHAVSTCVCVCVSLSLRILCDSTNP